MNHDFLFLEIKRKHGRTNQKMFLNSLVAKKSNHLPKFYPVSHHDICIFKSLIKNGIQKTVFLS